MGNSSESKKCVDTFKGAIANRIDQVAGSLGMRSETGGEAGPLSQQASAWLHQSAQYIRTFDLDQADADLKNQIRRHPGKSILIGFTAGIIVGFMVRRL